MNACVNDDACIGCGTCLNHYGLTNIAPAVFELNDVGKAYALDTAEENRSAVQEAIDACPTAAISWTD